MVEQEFPRHPDLEAVLPRTEFLTDSYLGGLDYKKEAYLPKYSNEDDKDYKERLLHATYANHCAAIVEIYNNYLYTDKIERDVKNLQGTEFDLFMDDADMMGRSYEKMVRELSKQSGASGFIGVIIDKPQGEELSKQAELDKGIRPFMSVYVASSIIDYKMEYVNGARQLTELVLQEDTGKTDIDTYKVWYLDRWEVWERATGIGADNKWKLEDTGPNVINFIPFVSIINRDNKFHPIIGKSDIADIADIDNRIYRLDSNAMEILDKCSFPFLQGPESTISKIDELGITTMIGIDDSDGDTKPELKFTEPIHTSLPQGRAEREICIEEIKRLSKLEDGQGTAQAESGVALEIKFRPLNAMLSEKAENMELSEVRILTIVGKYLKQEFVGSVVYPREFAVRDTQSAIDEAVSAKMAVNSRTFKAEIEKTLALKLLPDAETKVLETILAEIDAAAVEPEIPDPNDFNTGGGNEEEG